MTSSEFSSSMASHSMPLQSTYDSQILPYADLEDLKEAEIEDRHLKTRIRKLRIVSRSLALFISIAVLVPTALTLYKFLSTRTIYRTVALPSGQSVSRTPWAHNTRAWPTYMYFGVAAVSVLLNFTTMFSYKFGIEKANVASVVTSTFSWINLIGNLVVWCVAAGLYRAEKNKNGKSNDLWGWTCSAGARAIQKEFVGDIDFSRYCNVQFPGEVTSPLFTAYSAVAPPSDPTSTFSPSSHYTTFITSGIPFPSSVSTSQTKVQSSTPGTPSYSTPQSQTSSTDTIPADPNIPFRPGYRSVAYYGSWDIYTRNFQPQEIPAKRLTHLLYSFADNKPDGTVFLTDSYADAEKHYATDSWNDVGNNLYGSLKQLQILKAKNRNLKVLLSIGGWTYTNTNKHMDGPMATAEGRQRFASSCVELIRDYGFDGIDVDWEYPKDKEQGHQWLELLKEIRSQMNKYADKFVHKDDSGYELKPKFLLTIASPAGEKNYRNLPLREISEVTDFINLMAYDYAGSWDKQTGHNSNLYPSTSNPLSTPFNTASVLAAYNAAGVPSSKLNLGMPLYGRSFTNTQGVGKSFDSTGEGSFEKGIYDFKDLPVAGAQEYYDEEVGASYSYDEGSGTFVSYDTVAMALKKVDYIAQQKLGGAMWWEISGDKTDNAGSIVQNVIEKMRGGGSGAGIESSSNWLLYPDSKFDNIRNGVLTPQVAQRLRRA
ncbi:hypothetical protein J4E82_000885 [Alternaria postmessia]|uniref:uncharacterized protein n=1 Tax=Alternaria postmessia TaxID=1187938 RepID=UPI00222529BB|nr:uncharacterized protein J4E82_000885 [Alternaria postmessia]KAI5380309.1 hypothetical protein J4E82_000885 [Alternaria postmessia]